MESPLCPPDTRLIETLRWDGTGLVRRDLHLARLARSAAALGFCHDAEAVDRALAQITGPDPLRVRLTLGQGGDAEVTTAPLGPTPAEWRVALHPARLHSGNPWLRHKTTQRALFDTARANLPAGIDEWIFANERDEICEGTITTLFFDPGQGGRTPPVACGCLPGILREERIALGQCGEGILTLADLPGVRLTMGNSLRELIPARLVPVP